METAGPGRTWPGGPILLRTSLSAEHPTSAGPAPSLHPQLASLSMPRRHVDTDSHDTVQSAWNSLCSLGWSITLDPLSRTLKR